MVAAMRTSVAMYAAPRIAHGIGYAMGGGGPPPGAAAAPTGAAGAAGDAITQMVQFAKVVYLATKGLQLMGGAMVDVARAGAAGAAESRGELSKAFALRAQPSAALAALPIVGGLYRQAHEAQMLRERMPEHIETAQILEQQRRSTVELANMMRVQVVSLGLQAKYYDPATARYQQRMVEIEAGPVAKMKDIRAQEAHLQGLWAWENKKIREGVGREAPPMAIAIEQQRHRADLVKQLELLRKDEPRYAEIEVKIGETRKLYGELWQKEFYQAMTPQAAGHWGAFGAGAMPTGPPAADPSISTLVLIHQVLEEISKKLPPGKGQ